MLLPLLLLKSGAQTVWTSGWTRVDPAPVSVPDPNALLAGIATMAARAATTTARVARVRCISWCLLVEECPFAQPAWRGRPPQSVTAWDRVGIAVLTAPGP